MRIKLEIPKNELQVTISHVEKDGPLKNRAALFEAVANTTWAKCFQPKPVTASVAQLRAKEYDLNIKTPVGKRGRGPMTDAHKAALKKGRGAKRVSRAEKLAANPLAQQSLELIEKYSPARYSNTVKSLRKGSLKAALKMKCLECSDFQTQEIKHCPVLQCPLHLVRPYQPRS